MQPLPEASWQNKERISSRCCSFAGALTRDKDALHKQTPLHTTAALQHLERTSGWVHIWQRLLSPPHCQGGSLKSETAAAQRQNNPKWSGQTAGTALGSGCPFLSQNLHEPGEKSQKELEGVTCCSRADTSTAGINGGVTAKLLPKPVSPEGTIRLHSAGGPRQTHEPAGWEQPSVHCRGRKGLFLKTCTHRTGCFLRKPAPAAGSGTVLALETEDVSSTVWKSLPDHKQWTSLNTRICFTGKKGGKPQVC